MLANRTLTIPPALALAGTSVAPGKLELNEPNTMLVTPEGTAVPTAGALDAAPVGECGDPLEETTRETTGATLFPPDEPLPPVAEVVGLAPAT